MDRIKESAPFIKAKADRAQEYSKVEEHDSEEDSQYETSRAQLRSSRWRLVPLASSFLLGVLAMVLAFAAWEILFASKAAPVRTFPDPPQGVAADGTPLSWANGDCGNSPAEAQALGCRYSIVLHTWLKPDCLTDADMEDEVLMYEGRDWPYEIQGRNLTMDELRSGNYHHFSTSFDWHVTHCMYVWKRLHRVMLDVDQKLDSYTGSIRHTSHCVDMIGGDPGPLKFGGTKIFVKYPKCA